MENNTSRTNTCFSCVATLPIDERQETSSLRNPSWESCCKRGSVQLQLLPDPPQYLKSGLNAFQIHGTLCHHHSTLIPIKGIVPSYTQLYIYNPSYNAQRLSERNENLDNEIIENPSTLLSQCNPFTCIYRHVYEILSSHESSIINSEDRANNNSSAEGELPYIIISSSMGMHLVEGGVRRTHNLTTMEEVAAVVPIE
ncbi:hypothetical protein G6F70_000624 [Rhizopus microsporus]|nr:hypothetical protein G6F71_000806 [Rhizopus microsporus]KAG1204309.1 hypothetical protein G6F70_000624 [Rhizopus microsporus]KAG1215675.1 hypothetical protein G6F69_000761 [Rhizopus microsporus]